METQEDLATLRVERRIGHPPQDVWEALTDEEQVRQWMPTPYTTIDGRVDGHVEIDGPMHITGRILAWDPPRLFEHEFRLAPCKAAPAGEDAVMRYELVPDGDGCLLIATMTRLTPASVQLFSGGMPTGLARLEAYLDAKG